MTAHGRQQPNQGIHTPFAWTFADAASRNAFTPTSGIPNVSSQLTSNDLSRIALQLDDNSGYLLASISPIIWSSLIGGTFNASGDLSGNSSTQTVIGIQTNQVQSGVLGAPQDGF